MKYKEKSKSKVKTNTLALSLKKIFFTGIIHRENIKLVEFSQTPTSVHIYSREMKTGA